MKKTILKYKVLIAVSFYLLYHFLFWKHNLGINWVIFNVVTIALVLALNPNSLKKSSRIILFIGFLLTGFAFIWHYSTVAMLAHASILFLLIAALQEEKLTMFLYILGKAIQNYFSGTWNFLRSIKFKNKKINQQKAHFLLKKSKITVIIPIIFIGIFFMIFMNANPYFAELVFLGFEQIDLLLSYFADMISITYIFFMLSGLWWIFHFFEKSPNQYLLNLQKKVSIHIFRMPKKVKLSFGILSLKSEYLSGIVMIAGVNILLLIINFLDIKNIWLFWDWSLAPNLKDILHAGTYWLIFSILLSMAILIYYFRKNLNFYPNNFWLKHLAYLWIFQNGILAISVAIRCFYYIYEYGLAYKRIGVLIFLVLVFFGLFTMFLKIHQKRSFYYLLHRNTWALLIVFMGMSLVDWDSLIVIHNLKYHAQSKKVDLGFELSLSDKTIPILYQNRHKFKNRYVYESGFRAYETDDYGIPVSEYIEKRIERFKAKEKKESWQSWNRADTYTWDFLSENKL